MSPARISCQAGRPNRPFGAAMNPMEQLWMAVLIAEALRGRAVVQSVPSCTWAPAYRAKGCLGQPHVEKPCCNGPQSLQGDGRKMIDTNGCSIGDSWDSSRSGP